MAQCRQTETIGPGVIVRYAHEWCTTEERGYLFVVKEDYPDVKRCLIACINGSLSIPAVETVTYDMIVPLWQLEGVEE